MRRSFCRNALRWGRLDLAPGYLCLVVDRWGSTLAEPEPIFTSLPNGCRLRCDSHDFTQRWIWFHGTYEPIEANLFTQLLRPGMTVIDVGANAGQYTLLASTIVGPTGSGHSFEPVPQTFARLERAVNDNQRTNVHIHQAALWREETTLSLTVPAGLSNLGYTGTFSAVLKGDGSSEKVEAKALRLDKYVEERALSRVDVIKMDIEGAEPAALAGARPRWNGFGRWLSWRSTPRCSRQAARASRPSGTKLHAWTTGSGASTARLKKAVMCRTPPISKNAATPSCTTPICRQASPRVGKRSRPSAGRAAGGDWSDRSSWCVVVAG
jgi:FkbM family methyltransferase